MDDVLLVRVKGEMDLATADEIRRAIDKRMEGEKRQHLLLNLSHVSFIDSSGVGVILGRYRSITRRGGRLAIVQPQPQVRRVLEIAGLSRLACFCRSEGEALYLLHN